MDTLETWRYGVDRADTYLRQKELETIATAEQSWGPRWDIQEPQLWPILFQIQLHAPI